MQLKKLVRDKPWKPLHMIFPELLQGNKYFAAWYIKRDPLKVCFLNMFLFLSKRKLFLHC